MHARAPAEMWSRLGSSAVAGVWQRRPSYLKGIGISDDVLSSVRAMSHGGLSTVANPVMLMQDEVRRESGVREVAAEWKKCRMTI